MSDITYFGDSTFRIKRPLITTSGISSEPDAAIEGHLDELNDLLSKRILPTAHAGTPGSTHPSHTPDATRKSPPKAGEQVDETVSKTGAGGSGGGGGALVSNEFVRQLLARPLSPKHVPPTAGIVYANRMAGAGAGQTVHWDPDSLMAVLSSTPESDSAATLSEFIDATSALSALKYDFQSSLSDNWNNLDYNTKSALERHPAITDYLIAYGYLIMGLQEVNGLANFLFGNRQGAKNVVNYGIVSAARSIIYDEHLEVPDYNLNGSAIVRKIIGAGLTVSAASFSSSLQALVNDFVFNKPEADLIDQSNLVLGLPDSLKPQLIQYIKASPVKITTANAEFFLPIFAQQILGNSAANGAPESNSESTSDQDFDVQYFEDGQSQIHVSELAVKCAAQLYHNMVLGDELEVFNAMNYFTNKFLIRGGIEITDARLRDDLQMYVFSNKFTDPRSGKVNDRTRPAERHMFYRQVFNWGSGKVTPELIVNPEFPRLWKVLILESAKYIERAQISPNPNSFVSRQNVMQAVEDLQYNLSTHCTGMANVITPLIYGELNFIITRIFMHPEILRQVVPQGGTWWRVVETLYMGMKNTRPRSTVIYNKAKLGDSILRSIAVYNPSTFEQDGPFSSFISDVDAFITTQSILQEGLTDSLVHGDADDDARKNADRPGGGNSANPGPAAAPAMSGNDEWAF